MSRLRKVLISSMIIILFSCEEGSYLNEKEIKIIETVLISDNIAEKKDGDYYFIEVLNSDLKTEYGREMGASLASLIIYDRIYNDQSSLSYNSYFGVKFIEDGFEYKFSLPKLSQANEGRELINEFIIRMMDGEETNRFYYKAESNLSNLDWTSIKDIGEIGFKESLLEYYEVEMNSILFHYEFEPSNKTLWFYYSPENKKIISIINPYDHFGE